MANEQLYNFISKQLNPVDPKTRLSLTRPDFLIDDPLSTYRKALGATLSTNIFEGVQSYYGIVLLRFEVGEKDTEYWNALKGTFGSALSWFNPEQQSRAFCFCMIPELHGHLGIPFDHGWLSDEYIKRSLRFPIFMDERPTGGTFFGPADLEPGYIVNITFKDTNLSRGSVHGVVMASSYDQKAVQSASATEAHANGDASSSGSPAGWSRSTGPCKDVERDDRGWATAGGIIDAYFDDENMDWSLAYKIEEVALNLGMDPAWLANVIYFESGAGVSGPAFSPSAVNPKGGATGLIQFTETTANELDTTLDVIAQMYPEEQMDLVQQYFEMVASGPPANTPECVDYSDECSKVFTSQHEVFMAVFHRPAVGGGENFNIHEDILNTKGKTVADKYLAQNNGMIYAGEYASKVVKQAKICPPESE